MAGESLVLDSVIESATNAPLWLTGFDDSWGLRVLEHSYPPPGRKTQWAGSSDTEGELPTAQQYQNREIPASIRAAEPTGAASTGVITNPRAALTTTSWTNGGSSLARYLLGDDVPVLQQGGSDTAFKFVSAGNGQLAYADFAVTNGTAYSLSAWVYLGALTATSLNARIYSAGFGAIKAEVAVTTVGSWAQVSTTFTADATATWTIAFQQVGAGGATSYFAAQVVTGSTAQPYFDGDTPGCAWTGTHHASTSTRPATGGPRFDAMLSDLQKKVTKLQAEGGTLTRYTPTGNAITFDVVEANLEISSDNVYIHSRRADCSLTLTARPLGRGRESTLADHAETSLPALIFTESAIAGDVPALGRLTIDEDQGADQSWLTWGMESRYFDTADPANKKLFFQAEALTPLSTSAIAAGSATPSGSGSNVMRNTDLTTTYQALFSTQLLASTHLGHVGTYRIYGRFYRPTGNTGAVSVALEWSIGDFLTFTQNASTDFDADEREGAWVLVDLGLVTLPKVISGTQQWQGRVLGKSTVAGDEVDCDYLMMVPAVEGSGVVSTLSTQMASPQSWSAQSGFDTESGAINGDSLATGGTWATSGTATDFSAAGGVVTRSTVSEGSSGRVAIAGSATPTAIAVGVDFKFSATPVTSSQIQYVIARWTDANNQFYVRVVNGGLGPGTAYIQGFMYVAGVPIPLTEQMDVTPLLINTFYRVTTAVAATGEFRIWLNRQGEQLGNPIGVGLDAALATGGALASGKSGFADAQPSSTPATRTYDNFAAWVPSFDAGVRASQSLQVRHDSVIREDSGGTIWTPVSDYEGDLLHVPCAGAEDRGLRGIVKASRNNPESGTDPNIDDISAQLSVTPRYLTVPS